MTKLKTDPKIAYKKKYGVKTYNDLYRLWKMYRPVTAIWAKDKELQETEINWFITQAKIAGHTKTVIAPFIKLFI